MNRYLTHLLTLYKNKQLSQDIALSLIEEYKNHHQRDLGDTRSHKIAIVGMSARMPLADNSEEFWKLLATGKNCVRTFPESRKKDIDPLAEQIPKEQFVDGKRYWIGGFLNEVDKFDNDFFDILPADAKVMDPQQRMFLEMAYEAFQDAGYTREQLRHTNTGVYLGDVLNEYQKIIPHATTSAVVGNVTPFITSRVSYYYDFHGPTLNISTTCSTSLVAVHAACQALINKECDMALTGAINLRLFPFALKDDPVDALGITTQDDCCRAFDNQANGIVRGEGGGALVLKPYDKAVNDGDHIYAIILGSSVNNDGRSSSIGAPNPLAQEKLLKSAWEKSKIDPRTIQYIEAHGTGTHIGDPIEVNGINRAFSTYTQDKQFCGLGSVKTNLGHLTGGASGLTGLIKTVLSLKNQKIPPTLHFKTPNELINFPDSTVYITDQLIPWPKADIRRAGVSAFGFNGTNCHVVLEEGPKATAQEKDDQEYVLVLSHRTETGLKIQLERFKSYLEEHGHELLIGDVCYTMSVCRDHFKKRCAVVASSVNDLLAKLKKLLLQDSVAGMIIEGSHEALNALGQKHLTQDVDWKTVFKKRLNKVSLPTYSFEKKRFWIEAAQYGIEIKDSKRFKAAESTLANRIEDQLISLFKDVMGLEEIRITDNFFELGGDSLLGIQLINEIHKAFNKKISYFDLFSNPRLIDLVGLLKGKEEQLFKEIQKLSEQEEYPLSFGQRRLWILHQMQDNPVAYNMYEAYTFAEELHLDNFKKALDGLLERHVAFRTVFTAKNGTAFQSFTKTKSFALTTIDLRNQKDADKKALEHIEEFKLLPFDLEKGPLARALLIQISPQKQIFLFVMHHIISDGWSVRLIVQEVLKTYHAYNKALLPHHAPLRIDYHDYAHWQHQVLSEKRFIQLEKYWLNKFGGTLPVFEITGDKPRPVVFTFKGSRKIFEIPSSLVDKLNNLATKQNATLFMSLLTTMYIYINKYTGQQDLIVGTPVSGRSHLDLKSIVGFFVNTLSLRFVLDPALNFLQILSKVREDVLEAFEHQDYPFDLLVDKLKLKRDTSRSPLFNINIAFQNFELDESSSKVMEELKTSRFPLNHHSCKWDLEFEFVKQADGSILTYLEYYKEIYSDEMIHSMMENLLSLLEAISRSPQDSVDTLRLKHESANLISAKNAIQLAPQCIHHSFEKQVADNPNAPAVKYNETFLSYQELNAKANKLARFLTEQKMLAKDELVGILMENSTESIISILGVLKAGAAYVPMDIKWPQDRQKTILKEGKIRTVLTTKKYLTIVNSLQWCTDLESYICLDAEDIHSVIEKQESNLMDVELWNHVAEQASDEITASGWISSYTGLPITKDEMDEYEQNVFEKLKPILSKETRVLEVGCGSGLTAFAIAPYVSSYLGTDLSSAVIARNSSRADLMGLQNLEFKECFADQIDQFDRKFDVVIINSVIHCFSGLNYLRDVIRKVINKCSDQATLFLGDLMDQDLKDELVKSFQDFKQKNQEKGYRTKTDWSRELFVSRRFLEDLQADFPVISAIKFSNKIHTIENELTLFRYDAVLSIDKTKKTSIQSKYKHQYSLKDLLPYSESNLGLKTSISDLAYVIFTSGSTGKPKGVMVEHGTVWKYINWAIKAYFHDTQEKPCFPFYSPLTFDLTVTSVFSPLLTGSYLRVYQGEFDEVLQGLIQYQDCNILKLTPTHLSMFLEMNQSLPTIKKFILGGEALYSAAVNSLHELYKTPIQIYNEYGPTEATVGCIVYENKEKSSAESIIPIGEPMSHVKIHLLNEGLKPVPIGSVGEICIAGDCLARGYLNNREMTSEKFVNDPFSQTTKMYKTGDLGRILPNSVIEYLGRNDRQVKIKGYRIELNEIESKLYKYPSIKNSAVAVKEDIRGKVICAYYCGEPSLTDLKEFLQKELPEYMAPSYFIQMDEIPLSTNGKIDYLRLPDPFFERQNKNSVLPRNENEKALVQLWGAVLNIPQKEISIEDDFFDLGGDSIIAMRLLPKLSELGMKLSIKEIFQYRTISAICHYAKNHAKNSTQVISQDAVSGNIELTPIQKWFFEIQMPHPEFFNMSHLFSVSYDVDEDLLEKAILGCIDHHDILRDSFKIDGEDIKQTCVAPESVSFKLIKHSLVGLDPQEQLLRMHAISNEVHGSFDLQKPPLIKAVLIDLGNKQKRLLIVVHHLVFDGVSWRYLIEDIESLYHSKLKTKLPPKTHSFQKWSETLENIAATKQLDLDYWLKIASFKPQSILEKPGSQFFVKDYLQEVVILNQNLKNKLFAAVSKELNMNDLLLSALFLALSDEFHVDELLINHEGHGRFEINHVDISRTIGWFTSIYPLFLAKQATVTQTMQNISDTIRSVNSIDLNYGIGRYLQKQPQLQKLRPEVLFNYFGRVGADLMNNKKSLLTDCEQLMSSTSHPLNKMPHSLEVNALATEEHIQVCFLYDSKSYSQQTMTKLFETFHEKIEMIIENISQQKSLRT